VELYLPSRYKSSYLRQRLLSVYNCVVLVQGSRPPFVKCFNPSDAIPTNLMTCSLDYGVTIVNRNQILRTP
jgi:hypothetical protein